MRRFSLRAFYLHIIFYIILKMNFSMQRQKKKDGIFKLLISGQKKLKIYFIL